MAEPQPRVRLRQAVLVAAELEPVASALRSGLGLGEPFRDPGVAEFGLQNAVFAIGDCFLEVISPLQPGTAAGRYLERHGDGGYMAIFDLEDLAGARERAAGAGIRVVWQIDLPDISGTHLHPADMRGAIVSLDRSEPYGSWRWGGGEWIGKRATGAAGHLAGITVAVDDPDAVAARWGEILAVPLGEREQPTLALERGEVRFVRAEDERSQGLSEISLAGVSSLAENGDWIELGGVRLRAAALD